MSITTPTRAGIPTRYRETRFRSRLEARWAAFFDLVEWSWVYEPFDADGWIPDFLVRASGVDSPGLLIEVGPCETLDSFKAKAQKPIAAYPPEGRPSDWDDVTEGHEFSGIPERTTLVLGLSPLVLDPHDPAGAGYLTDDTAGGGPEIGLWGQCSECGIYCITHRWMTYTHLPCHHYTGGDQGLPVSPRRLHDLWAEAGNQVQWRR